METMTANWNRHWQNTQQAFWAYRFLQEKQLDHYVELIANRLNANSRILEIGAGTGYLSRAICNTYGCSAVLVDSAEESARMFERHTPDPRISFRLMNAFDLDERESFDMVFSDGLIEHFTGTRQQELISIHAHAAKKDGFVILFVPKKWPGYGVIKKTSQKLGLWNFGFERPYAPQELQTLLTQNSLRVDAMVNGFWEIGVRCRATSEKNTHRHQVTAVSR